MKAVPWTPAPPNFFFKSVTVPLTDAIMFRVLKLFTDEELLEESWRLGTYII